MMNFFSGLNYNLQGLSLGIRTPKLFGLGCARFFMMIFVLMSGIFTPAESMPDWAQQINRLNPAAYFIRVIRMIALKGAGVMDIRFDFLGLALLAVSTTVLASTRYKKTN